MPSVMEMLISGGERDQGMQRALAGGLRRKQEIAELGQLTGDRVITPMAQNLQRGVERDVATAATQADRAASREIQEAHYAAQAGQSALANTMAERRLEETIRHNREMENRQNATVQRTLNADVRRLSAALTKAQAPEITSGIEAINEELAPYIQEGGNLPGVGGVANILPGFTADARAMQDRLAKIRNIILKARSGGAVTPAEADRLLQEFSVRTLNTDEDFLRAWQDFTSAYQTGIANIHAGYTDEVNDTYQANMNTQMQAAGEQNTTPSSGSTPEVTPPQPPGGGVRWEDM